MISFGEILINEIGLRAWPSASVCRDGHIVQIDFGRIGIAE
jgi:hypothetical protein